MKKYRPEQIVEKLRQADVELGKGSTVPEVCRAIEVSQQTYYRWRQKYGGMSAEVPTRQVMSTDRCGRHDSGDQEMVAAARLAFDLALPTESEGNRAIGSPSRELNWVWRLYERAVGGFYEVVLSPQGWNVDQGRTLDWHILGKTKGIDEILPSMRTDIVLEHREAGKRIVIDTKFTTILVDGWHRCKSLRSGHIYQIYASPTSGL